MSDLDDETLVSFYRRLDAKDEEIAKLRAFVSSYVLRNNELESERQKLADEVAMYRDVLDNWDWAGLARDAKAGDFTSVADALASIARVDEARVQFTTTPPRDAAAEGSGK